MFPSLLVSYPHAPAIIAGHKLKVASMLVSSGWLRLEVTDPAGRPHLVSLGREGLDLKCTERAVKALGL
jgi:hypothetical protein